MVATLVLMVATLVPAELLAQRSRGQARTRPSGGQAAGAVSRGPARAPVHAAAPRATGRTAVPRQTAPYASRYYRGYYHRHYPSYPYYGWGWGGYYGGYYGWGWGAWGGWGAYYYPPFVSLYGWYPYPFGYYPPYYAFGPYDTSASVRVQVTPREAEVYVDGYYAGVVDEFDGTFQRLNVTPGSHEITVYLPGYRSATERRYFRPSAGYKIKQALDKLPAGTADDPKPQPSPSARSPIRRGGGEPGEPGIEPGGAPEPRWPDPYEPRSAPAPRDPNDPIVSAPVEPPPAAQWTSFGRLVVRVQPEGASVVIDGERWQGPEAEGRLQVQVSAGRHKVEISKDGYTPYSAEVEVRPGENTVLNVSLPPADRR
jgi:hypothetical protein